MKYVKIKVKEKDFGKVKCDYEKSSPHIKMNITSFTCCDECKWSAGSKPKADSCTVKCAHPKRIKKYKEEKKRTKKAREIREAMSDADKILTAFCKGTGSGLITHMQSGSSIEPKNKVKTGYNFWDDLKRADFCGMMDGMQDKEIIIKSIEAVRCAEKKHPKFSCDLNQMMSILMEEVGEISTEINDHHNKPGKKEYGNRIESEIYDTIAVLFRMLKSNELAEVKELGEWDKDSVKVDLSNNRHGKLWCFVSGKKTDDGYHFVGGKFCRKCKWNEHTHCKNKKVMYVECSHPDRLSDNKPGAKYQAEKQYDKPDPKYDIHDGWWGKEDDDVTSEHGFYATNYLQDISAKSKIILRDHSINNKMSVVDILDNLIPLLEGK